MDSSPDTPTPNAIVLHADTLAAEDDERAPQTQFVAERQVAFLEALAVTGNVRTAARRARVSHQTCYRARRGSAAFGRAWDAALVVARGAAEAQLADYALNGVEEEVWYHGELAGTRRRFSDRLLLAHLARLDRMRTDARIEALAEDFDALLTRLRRGEGIEVDPAPKPLENSPPGACKTRSMSASQGTSCEEGPEGGALDPADFPWEDDPRYIRWPQGSHRHRLPPPGYPEWEEDMDDPAHWVGGEYRPPLARTLYAMEDARPRGALLPRQLGNPHVVEPLQVEAFCEGVAEWWLVTTEEELDAALEALEGAQEAPEGA